MKDITFKVAPKGTGKTKWLLNKAYKYSRQHKVYFVTNDSKEWVRFCDKYFALFHEVCPVNKYEFGVADPDAVILIDNVFEQPFVVSNIEFLKRNFYKLFITVEGITDDPAEENAPEYTQLSFFDEETIR